MMVKQKDRTVTQFIYATLLGGLLLGYLLIQAFDHEPFSFPGWLAFLRVLAAIMGIWLGKLWKDKGFLLLSVFLLIQIIRVVFKDAHLIFSDVVGTNILNGLWVVAGCYSLCRILSVKQVKGFLKVIAALWTIGTVIHCGIALYAAWTDLEIGNLNGDSIWVGGSIWGIIWEERLIVSYLYPTMSGSVLSISGVIALFALVMTEKKNIKILYGLAILLTVIALGLTDARTSYISFSAGCGVIAGLLVLWHFRKEKDQKAKAVPGKECGLNSWFVAGICAIIVCVVAIVAISRITPLFNQIKIRGGLLSSIAYADEQAPGKLQVISRGFSGSDVLSGRIEVWKSIWHYVSAEPGRLLFGVSVYNPMSGPNQLSGSVMGHCHNMFLQILLESGLIGLLLILAFGLYTARNAWRIINSKTLPLWPRLIPAIVVSVLVGDLAECFGWFAEWKGPVLPFLFLTCGIINAIGGREGKQNKE